MPFQVGSRDTKVATAVMSQRWLGEAKLARAPNTKKELRKSDLIANKFRKRSFSDLLMWLS
ncbi:hypothetical protein PIB30_034193 [Stylosanthes scabra]|uniref:Uncharacterized protein n=1 Tax=Stylosanthes scabra TaxID=79078 RepID=A0ABU6RD77_9FABA|nr:hypothetical protein [Stylosanthes scabra]